jgi:hypothetical protein
MARLRVVFPLVSLLAVGCAASRNDSTPAPETSRSAADSAPPTSAMPRDESVAGVDDPTSESLSPLPPVVQHPRPAPPPPRPIATGSPYRVELLGAASNRLATFRHAGRTYVMGTLGSRYRIHVVNPTGRRVEAVVSVDGLDAIDGLAADFVHKSGYLIAPYGDVTIDGFRTSMEEVATFRFSSVPDSYAAREGSDRNVGVIGVAFFPERDRPPPPPPAPVATRPSKKDYYGPPAAPPSPHGGADGLSDMPYASNSESAAPSTAGAGRAQSTPTPERPGLGTEFGEQRSSIVEYVEFRRADPAHPSAVAEIRYNDRDGLVALGIPVMRPAPTELDLRESASPFPMNRFASAPPPRD